MPKLTGRPPRFCKDACRQAGFRRVTKLQRCSPAERVLLEHGFIGERLLKLARKVANDELRRRGASLGDRYDDLIGFLVETALRTAERFTPT